MTTTMKAFLEKLSADKELAIKASKLDKAELIALAKELGLDLTEADFAPDASMDDAELTTVVGGVQTKGLFDLPDVNTPEEHPYTCTMIGIDPTALDVALF